MATQAELTLQQRATVRASRALPKLMGKANLAVLRLTGGRVGNAARGIPIGVLTTTGRRTGQPRSVPVMHREHGDGWLVLACNSGLDRPPAWLLNLEASPDATFEFVAGEPRSIRARVLDQEERDRLWPELVAYNPVWAGFQAETERPIAVVELTPA